MIRIDTEPTRKIHFQQDYLGCVEDEANIKKKCDARRQDISRYISPCLSRWLDRLMCITMTAAVYMFRSMPTNVVFMSKNTQRYNVYDEKSRTCRIGIDMGAQADDCTCYLRAVMLFWHEYQALQRLHNEGDDNVGRSTRMYLWCYVRCLVSLPCSWIRQVYLELGIPANAIATTPIMKQRRKVKKTIYNQGDKKNKKLHSLP